MRNKRKQISAFIMLALLVIYTVLSQDLFVYAKQEEEVGISSKEKHIVGFSILDDNIQQQILPLGASETDIIFPDTLTVTVALSSTDTLPIQSTVEDQKLSETASPTPSPVEKTNVSDVPGEVDARNEKTLITPTPNPETGNLPDIQNNEILVEKETVNNDVLYSEIDPQEIKTLIQTEEIVLSNIAWKLDVDKSDSSEFITDEIAIGYNYVYTPVLPETDNEGNSLILDEDAILPEIHVTIEKQNIMMMNSTAAISGSCGENLTYSITGDESDGYVLTISGTGAMCNYEDTQAGATTAPWYAYNENLKTLIIEEGITSIGENAFKGCWGLEGKISIPDSVTIIGKSAFQNCIGFDELHLSNSLKEIEQDAFHGCKNLKGTIKLPESIESIGHQSFRGCNSFTGDLVIPASIKSIGSYAFYLCTGLGKNVYIKSKMLLIGEKAFLTDTITTIYGESGSDAERYAKLEDLVFKERAAEGFSNGEGSIDNPYLISNKAELLFFQQSVNSGTTYENMYVVLNDDIMLNEINDYDSWSEDNAPNSKWEGITGFAGTFNGKGHTIYGLYMNCSEENTGFFNEFNNLNKVTIKNVNFENIFVSGTNNVGGIVGKADYVQIENCSISGKIKGTGDNVGGFIGYSGSPGHRGTRVYDCTNSATIEGNNYVGGFTGQSYIGNPVGAYSHENVGGTEMIVLKNCKNKGNIIGNGDYVGGIAGYLNRSMNCGGLDIDNLSNSGSVIGNNNVGGIIGYLRSWVGSLGETTIDCCSNKGSITGNSSIAGIIGNSYWSGGTGIKINNIYNVGTIVGNDSVTGGIIGRANGGNNIACVFNIGKILPENGGALIGYSTGATFTNAYYSIDEGDSVNNNGAIKLSKEELKNVESFQEFDFSTIWKMTNVYPIFRWEEGEEVDTPDNIVGDFVVYSSYSDCTIGVGQDIDLRPAVKHKGEVVKDPDAYSYEIGNEDVLGLVEITYDDYGPTLELIGKKEGTSTVSFWHIPTGKKITVLVTVVEGRVYCDINKIAAIEYSEDVDKYVINSHMAFDSFHMYKNSDGTYTVIFDAYNALPYYGAVEVFDTNNNRIQVKRIDKKKDYQTNLEEVWDGACNVLNVVGVAIIKIFTGKDEYIQYRDPLVTKKTEKIEVTVPDGGYILISNNYLESFGCAVYNTIDLTLASYDLGKGLIKDNQSLLQYGDMFQAFSNEVQKRATEKLISKGLDGIFFDELKENFKSKALSGISIDKLSEGIFDLETAFEEGMASLVDLDYADILQSSSQKAGFQISEEIIEIFGAYAGAAIEGIFDVNKGLNTYMQFMYFVHSDFAPSLVININSNQDRLVSNNVVVENEEGIPIAYDSLFAENVSSHAEHQYIYEDFESNKQLTIYNITLYRNDVEVQPEGTIRVSIPLPTSYNPDTVKVYRAEKDGSYTDMHATYENGNVTFLTTHLSIYVCVGDLMQDNSNNISENSVIDKSISENAIENKNIGSISEIIKNDVLNSNTIKNYNDMSFSSKTIEKASEGYNVESIEDYIQLSENTSDSEAIDKDEKIDERIEKQIEIEHEITTNEGDGIGDKDTKMSDNLAEHKFVLYSALILILIIIIMVLTFWIKKRYIHNKKNNINLY